MPNYIIMNGMFRKLCFLIAALLLAGCSLPSAVERDAVYTQSAETQIAVMAEAAEAELAETAAVAFVPTETPVPTAAPQTVEAVDYFLADSSQERYADWIRKLSGELPVTIGGQEYTIETRYSYAMFNGQENAKAAEFLLETLRQWVPEEYITYEPYEYRDSTSVYTWYNIIVTFPGTVSPDEQILFTAHFDSCVALTDVSPLDHAPGANDNGTGVAALLEAMPTFAKTTFDKTLKVIFFSGEENFLQGSQAYVNVHSGDNILGVVNMDMYGNDPENARCFEIHVGTLEGSDPLGEAFRQAIADYDLNLTYDYFRYVAYEKGDHFPFWSAGIPAMTAMENFVSDATEGGCGPCPNPKNWHGVNDYIADINVPYAYDISRAGVITVLRLAGAHPIAE